MSAMHNLNGIRVSTAVRNNLAKLIDGVWVSECAKNILLERGLAVMVGERCEVVPEVVKAFR